jgi:hypothetical protein
VASPMIGIMAGARNRIGHFVFASPRWGMSRLREVRDRSNRERVSLAVDSSHSVRPPAGEVVTEGTTARGYSTRSDAREARLECGEITTYPTACPIWTGSGGGQRRFISGDVKARAVRRSTSPLKTTLHAAIGERTRSRIEETQRREKDAENRGMAI